MSDRPTRPESHERSTTPYDYVWESYALEDNDDLDLPRRAPDGNDWNEPAVRAPRRARASADWWRLGVAALAVLSLLQLTLWWLPEGLRCDPLSLAPRLPRQLSILAPNSLRRVTVLRTNVEQVAADPAADSLAGDSAADTLEGESTVSDRAIIADTAPRLGADGESETGSVAPAGWTSSATLARQAAAERVDQLLVDLRKLDATELPERKQLALDIYAGMCELGAQLHRCQVESEIEVGDVSRELHAAAKSIMAGIAAAPEKLAFVSSQARRRVASDVGSAPDGKTGLALAGRVQTIREMPNSITDEWQLSLSSPYDNYVRYIVTIGVAELDEVIANGDLLLVLGCRIKAEEVIDPQDVHMRAAAVYVVQE